MNTKPTLGLMDRFYLRMHAAWVNRSLRQFGPTGALGIQIHVAQELVKKAAKDLGRHPEILAQDAIDMAGIKLFAVNKGGVQ